MRARRILRRLALPLAGVLAACTTDGPTTGRESAAIAMRFLTPATVRTLVVEVTGPGIDSAVVLNLPVGADSVTTGSLLLPSGSARRFVVSAMDTADVVTHRADTTITLQPGTNPDLALRLEPLPGALGITVTFGGVRLTVSDSSLRVITVGDSASITASATRTDGTAIPTDSLTWASANPAVVGVVGGHLHGIRAGETHVTVSYRGAAARVGVQVLNPWTVAPVAALIDGGIDHSCAILSDGRVSCWGEGGAGQLGTGLYARRANPVPIVGDQAFATLSNGDFYSCGITTAGRLFCWGRNLEGQIGDGALVDRFSPVEVDPTQTFKAVATGQSHTCALTTAGAALCWGQNGNGQLGDGSTTNRPTPVAVSGEQVFVGVAVGTRHSCAWTAGGQTFCWGRNAGGELGDGTTTARFAPTRVAGSLRFVEVTAQGSHSCGLTITGVTYCWGVGSAGQLGTGTFPATQTTPARVSGSTVFVRVSAGRQFTCGIATDRSVHCWGRNTAGELGDGTSTGRAIPAPVSTLSQVVAIGAGSEHTCAITAAGTAQCWGRNSFSQLGEVEAIRSPAIIPGLSGATLISGGYFNSCSLNSTGNTTCWGSGLAVPTPFATEKTFTSIDHGDAYVCGIDAARSAWCWGANNAGKLGNGTEQYSATPQAVSGGLQFLRISGFYTHACGISTSNAIWCWGANHLGQIDDSGVNRLVPTAIPSSLSFADVSVGLYYSCALTTDGAMYCWGNNVSGSSALVPVLSAHRFIAIATSGNPYFCGIRADKQVVCTGSATNTVGQLIEGLSSAERIEGFANTLCATTTDRSVYCWGSNELGQLGDPSFVAASSDQAVRVAGLSSAVAIGGSYDTPCAALSDGTVWCWGFNANGEAGQPPQRFPRTVVGTQTFKTP